MSADVFAALDLELTGLKPRSDEIIEIGVVRCTPDQVLERWSTLVRPQTMPSLRIQRITGITPEMLAEAPNFEEIEPKLRSLLDGAGLIGHNVGFDQSFLDAVNVHATHPATDTLLLAQIIDPAARSHRLGDLCAEYGIELDQAHRALADAEASRRLLLALQERFERLPGRVRDELCQLAVSLGMLWPPGSTILRWASTASSPPAPTRAVALRTAYEPDQVRLPRGSLAALTERAFQSVDEAAFEERDEQLAMARDVAVTLESGGHAIVEAGTGTGKSLAYLVPATLWALKTGHRVAISTHTINLQQQLESKDLPMARRLIAGVSEEASGALRSMVVKGRANYLCRRKLTTELGRAEKWPNPQLLARALVWAAQTERGDRAELRLPGPELGAWDRLSAASTTCLIDGCPYVMDGSCFLSRVRDQAFSAHLVVLNHALLVSDLVYGSATLPDTAVVIVDEAHALEDVATDQMSIVMNEAWLREELDRLGDEDDESLAARAAPTMTQELRRTLKATEEPLHVLYSRLETFASNHSEDSFGGADQVTLTQGARNNPGWLGIEEASEQVSIALGTTIGAAEALHADLEGRAIEARGQQRQDLLTAAIETQGLAAGIRERVERLHQTLTVLSPEEIAWIRREQRRSGDVAVHSAPLSVAERLLPLWVETHAAILTGATLATAAADEGGFDYLRQRLGVEDAAECQYGSPFDYERACRIFLPTDAVDAVSPGHNEEVARAVHLLAEAAQGRTMALFRSYGAMRQVARIAEPLLEEAGLVLVTQGRDGSAARIVDALRSDPRTVAFGVASLWTGVDLPGDALSLLIITRLPFAPPGDPVLRARGEQYDNEFMEYALPAAVLQFRQGFGRLLRTQSDRGAVVVLDGRIATRRYGTAFLQALPPAPVSRIPTVAVAEELRRFLPPPRTNQ